MSYRSPKAIITSVFGNKLSSTSDSGFECFQLPVPKDADYQFSVTYHGDEPQIEAKLLAQPDLYFWYLPFDGYAYADVDEMDEALKIALTRIAHHETRIIQKKGILMQSFVCDYFDEGWKKLSGTSAFRFSNFRFPVIQQTRCVYYSAALLETNESY